MDQRRQGMICVGLGLGMLGGFACFEISPPAITDSSPTVTNFTVRETLDGGSERECLRLRYRGQGEIESFLGRKAVSWEVDIYRLPAGEDGLIPHVVHVDKTQGSGRGHPYDAIEIGDSVTACWMDRRGKIVRSIMPPGSTLPEIDPAAFLMPLPEFASRGKVRLAEGSDGSHWQMEAATDPADASDQFVVEVVSDSVAQRVEQIDRQMRFCYDRRSRILLTMELFEQGHWRQKRGESRSQLELVSASEIPPDRVRSMTSDLRGWEKYHTWVRKVARQASAPPRALPPSVALVSTSSAATLVPEPEEPPYAFLDDLPSRTTAFHDSMSDSVLRTGLASGLFSLHASRSQLLGERPSVEALHRTKSIAWTSTDLAGITRTAAEYYGKPVVMGFLCRGTPHATRTIRTVAELRRRFPEDQLAVLGFATTYSRHNAEAISRAIGPTVPVFHDLQVAEQMNLFRIGKSTLILLDGCGKPRFVHTWQPTDLVEEICSQIEEIRSPPASDSGSLDQITLATP